MVWLWEGPANMVYPEAIKDIMQYGSVVPSRNGETRELEPGIFALERPAERLVTAFGRPVNVAFALAEVLWILAGSREVEILKHYNSRIDQYSDDSVTFNAAYGHRMRKAAGFDQLDDIIRTLRADPFSRQAVMTIWDPKNDRGWDDYDDTGKRLWTPRKTADRACNLVSHALIRDGKLNWHQTLRSNDSLWGVPYNWIQWTNIMEWVACHVGVEMGTYFHVSDSLHVYDYHYEEAREIRTFDLYQCGFTHNKMEPISDSVLGLITRLEAKIRKADGLLINLREHMDSIRTFPLYWRNLLMVLLAHSLFKKGHDKQAFTVLNEECDAYGVAQIRFYYGIRWKKDEYKDLQQWISEMYPTEVLDWIQA